MSPTAAAAAKAAGDAWNEGKVRQQQGERLYPLGGRLLTHGDGAPGAILSCSHRSHACARRRASALTAAARQPRSAM